MTVDELIRALQALPADLRQLTVVTREESWLPKAKEPTIDYRTPGGLRDVDQMGERVVVI